MVNASCIWIVYIFKRHGAICKSGIFFPEDDLKSTLQRFGNQLTSSVKDVGDVYKNAEHVPDISTNKIKQAIDKKSKYKYAGFSKKYSVSQTIFAR